MSIVTKTGDDGTTDLWFGGRIGKDELRVECYGTIDELNSFLGDARHALKTDRAGIMVDEIQQDLFRVAGSLATRGDAAFVEPVSDEDVERVTEYVYDLEREVSVAGFVVPGSTVSSAKLDICRTVCRRAERRIVALARIEKIDPRSLQYVNRLSDLLFVLARYEEQAEGAIRLRGGSRPRQV